MSSKIPYKFLRHLLSCLILIFHWILLPIYLTLAVLLKVTRGVLNLYKNAFKPNLGDFLSGMNNIQGQDDPYQNPTTNICYYAILGGHLKCQKFIEIVERVIKENANTLNSLSRPRFPELCQHLTTWWGFSIWENEQNFCVADHVKMLDIQEMNERLLRRKDGHFKLAADGLRNLNEEDAANLCLNLAKVPFEPLKSPWELLIHHLEDTTLLIFRCHHALADGLSIMNFFFHLVDDKDVYKKILANVSVPQVQLNLIEWLTKYFKELIIAIITIILGSYEFIYHQLKIWDSNPWHNDFIPLTLEFHVVPFQLGSLMKVKQVAKKLGNVKFASILMASVTGGIRNFMLSEGIPVPDKMHMTTVIGMPRDIGRMTNNLLVLEVCLPTGVVDQVKVVGEIDQDYRRLLSSRLLPFRQILISFFGLFPRNWKNGLDVILPTCLFTNVPAFDKETSIGGLPLISLQGVADLPPRIGLTLFSFGYAHQLRLLVVVSKDIIEKIENVKKLSGMIQNEFTALEKLVS